MNWCLWGLALLAALLGLLALIIRLPRPDLARMRPGAVIRGCIAVMCLLTALGLVGLALLATSNPR